MNALIRAMRWASLAICLCSMQKNGEVITGDFSFHHVAYKVINTT